MQHMKKGSHLKFQVKCLLLEKHFYTRSPLPHQPANPSALVVDWWWFFSHSMQDFGPCIVQDDISRPATTETQGRRGSGDKSSSVEGVCGSRRSRPKQAIHSCSAGAAPFQQRIFIFPFCFKLAIHTWQILSCWLLYFDSCLQRLSDYLNNARILLDAAMFQLFPLTKII